MNIKTSIRKLTLLYSLMQFFYYFNFFWLIQNVYFLNNGINFKQLSILLGVWSLSIVAFEIPSGILADKIGRKPVIILGKIGFLLGILVFVYLRNFPGFLAGMILWGIHESFISGALEALVYDELRALNSEKMFNTVLSKATVSREIGLGLGVLIAGIITQTNINYNLIGSVAIALLGVIVSLLLPNPKSFMPSEETKLVQFFNQALRQVKNNKMLVNIIIFTLFILVSYQVISEYFVVTLKELSLNFSIIGVIAFLEMVFFSVGAYMANRTKPATYIKVYWLVALLMALLVLFIASGSLLIVIIGWLLLRAVKAYAEITTNTDWQVRVESSDRATTTSIRSFIGNLWYIPLAYLFGALADRNGLFNAFYLISIFAVIYIFILLGIKKYLYANTTSNT